jgi:hypothetical protein
MLIDPPSGWFFVVGVGNADCAVSTYYKIASSSEPSYYTWVLTEQSLNAVIATLSYRGVSSLGDCDAAESNIDPYGNPTAPSIAVTALPSWQVVVWGIDNGYEVGPLIQSTCEGRVQICSGDELSIGPARMLVGDREVTTPGYQAAQEAVPLNKQASWAAVTFIMYGGAGGSARRGVGRGVLRGVGRGL